MKNETKLYFLFHPQKILLAATQANESHVHTGLNRGMQAGLDLLLFSQFVT